MPNSTTITSLNGDCGLPEEQCDVVVTMKKVLFSITITLDVITLLVIILYRKYQSFSQRIFLNILTANLGEAIVNQVDDGHESIVCSVMGYFVQAVGFSLFMWVCGLTVFLLSLFHVEKKKRFRERSYMIVCWVLPFLLAIIPMLTDDYGPAGAFCWIRGGDVSETGDYFRFALWWIPVLIGIILIFTTFIFLHYKAAKKKQLPTDLVKRKLEFLKPLRGYAFSFLFMHLLMVTDRISTLVGDPVYVCRVLHILGFAPYGSLLCSLFYIMNGRKEFTMEKLRPELEHHKRRLMCRSTARITTFKPGTVSERPDVYVMDVDSEFDQSMNPQANRFPNYAPPSLRSNSPDPIEVPPENPAETTPENPAEAPPEVPPLTELSLSLPLLQTLQLQSTPLESLPSSSSPTVVRRSDSAELSFDIDTSLSEEFPSLFQEVINQTQTQLPLEIISVEPLTRTRPLGSSVRSNRIHNYNWDEETKHEYCVGSSDRQCESSRYESGSYPPPAFPKQESRHKRGPPSPEPTVEDRRPDTPIKHPTECTDAEEMLKHRSYTLHPNSQMVKVYIADENVERWESWDDNETVRLWVSRVKEDLPPDSTVVICDKDGAHFGKNITWKQVKSCGNIRIIVNSGITDVELSIGKVHTELESRQLTRIASL